MAGALDSLATGTCEDIPSPGCQWKHIIKESASIPLVCFRSYVVIFIIIVIVILVIIIVLIIIIITVIIIIGSSCILLKPLINMFA